MNSLAVHACLILLHEGIGVSLTLEPKDVRSPKIERGHAKASDLAQAWHPRGRCALSDLLSIDSTEYGRLGG